MPDFLPLHEHAPDPGLAALLAECADVLAPLLGPLWPVTHYKKEQFGPLTKYTIGPCGDEWLMLHYLAAPDPGPPHCHPCNMRCQLLQGHYLERQFLPERGTRDVVRSAGDNYTIRPERIHQILSVSVGGAWSCCAAGPVVREWRHYPELVAA